MIKVIASDMDGTFWGMIKDCPGDALGCERGVRCRNPLYDMYRKKFPGRDE